MSTPMGRLTAEEIKVLSAKTIDARSLSYSPYSKFRVGAVLVAQDGTHIEGANVENASYGACICAEQTAIVKAVTTGYKQFKAIGVASSSGTYTSPCGICRQVLREFAPNIEIYMFAADGTFVMEPLTAMLPHSFGPEDLDVVPE
ncbi:cytidine deaminase-like protein [Lipomyces tetrasporus]|uniref:Cytidine deaminase n=1 Tax=Lipomyces tetrasporus TaxID=54092 RepID=A0AAD7QN34_9ASCO|nr:cytidine deaminase-like protein [Lipomyces tetrasporus]KAJ8098025.1 cytidine deaminase-like protein [Lipomyces tetrasporus]